MGFRRICLFVYRRILFQGCCGRWYRPAFAAGYYTDHHVCIILLLETVPGFKTRHIKKICEKFWETKRLHIFAKPKGFINEKGCFSRHCGPNAARDFGNYSQAAA